MGRICPICATYDVKFHDCEENIKRRKEREGEPLPVVPSASVQCSPPPSVRAALDEFGELLALYEKGLGRYPSTAPIVAAMRDAGMI